MRKLSVNELDRLSIEAAKNAKKSDFCFVLDNIRSLANIGSIFRTADAFAVEKIWLCGISGTPPHRELSRTALGSEMAVAWEYAPDTDTLLDLLHAQGYIIASLEQATPSISLEGFYALPNQKYAIVLGNEVEGVGENAILKSDFCLEIPQFGTKHSLNVAVAAGIAAWQFTQKTQ